jgi:hypothetical protein
MLQKEYDNEQLKIIITFVIRSRKSDDGRPK